MNNKMRLILTLVFICIICNSCNIVKSMLPQKKDNYVNYNLLFADPETNNALNPSAAIKPIEENKIRIITINRITNDTIIEWVDPIDVPETSRQVLSAINQPNSTDSLAATPQKKVEVITKQSDLLVQHSGIVFKIDEEFTTPKFEKIEDTLFVTVSKSNMDAILIQLASGTFPTTNNLITTKPNKKKNSIKNLVSKKAQEEVAMATKPVIGIAKPKVEAPINNSILFSNSNTLVGDLMFDTDLKARVYTDQDSITQLMPLPIQNWNTFKCKTAMHYKSAKENQRFVTYFRMKKDSITWASVNFITELARAIISKDSVKAIDKLKDKFYVYDAFKIKELIKLPIEINNIQDILLGNIPNYGFKKSLAKSNEKGTAIKLLANGMSAVLIYNTDSTLKNMLILANGPKGSYSIRTEFLKYEETPFGKLSTRRNMVIIENKNETRIEMDLNKYSFEEELEYPFTIPTKFVEGAIRPNGLEANKQ
jgi:hypothetical protein